MGGGGTPQRKVSVPGVFEPFPYSLTRVKSRDASASKNGIIPKWGEGGSDPFPFPCFFLWTVQFRGQRISVKSGRISQRGAGVRHLGISPKFFLRVRPFT